MNERARLGDERFVRLLIEQTRLAEIYGANALTGVSKAYRLRRGASRVSSDWYVDYAAAHARVAARYAARVIELREQL